LAKKESKFLLAQLGVVLTEEPSFLPNRAMRDMPTPLRTANLVRTNLVTKMLKTLAAKVHPIHPSGSPSPPRNPE
jgi:hypothetical protein